MDINKIRNVTFISHGGAGKTSLVEAVIFDTGYTRSIGTSADGSGVMDYDPVEIERKITINAKVASVNWNEYLINIIDTPGYANYLHETHVAIAAAGSAVVIASAITGVKAETKRAWQYADEYSLPRLIFVNKMDKEHADFYRAISDVEQSFGANVVPLHLPIGTADNFIGVIDLIGMQAYIYLPGGGKHKIEPIPDDMVELANKYRNKLVEAVSESDDSLLEKYLENGQLTDKEIIRGVREATITKRFVPVLCGSATKNYAVKRLLDAIIDFLPSPLEEPVRIVKDLTSKEDMFIMPTDERMTAHVFKTFIDPYVGKISLFRVFSGSINNGLEVLNTTKRERERISQLYLVQGKNTIEVEEVTAGQIAMASRLRYTDTFDTFCDVGTPMQFAPIALPEPVISYSIIPKSKDDENKVSAGLGKLKEEDCGISIRHDERTHELLLSGMGRMHIETTIEKLEKKFNIKVDMKLPRVPYLETVKKRASGQGKYKKQSGGRGQYGDVWLEISPLERGQGIQFIDDIVGGVVPKNFIPAVEKGIRETAAEGVLSGYPMVDFAVSLYDGSYHTVDSSELAFKIAASMAFKRVATDAKIVLLEPIMDVDIFVPADVVGIVISDINARRGKIVNVEPQAVGQHIRAQVPMAEIRTYAPDLRSLTGGHGMFTTALAFYDELPSYLVDKIVGENAPK
ncbi:elongation factor G [Deferribacterales bacterium RsTz2092]|nr:elongation factor G [Deferribacterales bacterium]